MFDTLEKAPDDPILGLNEAFAKDTKPNKINLGVGVYKDGEGKTPILQSVKEAERRLVEKETTKSYLPIAGPKNFAAKVQGLLFGDFHEIMMLDRSASAQTPGGTGALRVAGEFIKQIKPDASIWMSDPTWANHSNVFKAAALKIETYPYYDRETKELNFDGMIKKLEKAPEGDVVLLHACCHNPSGIDLSVEQWNAVAKLAKEKKFMPLFDFAYQGFGEGIEEDAQGLRTVASAVNELIVCNSFSKNFGLYNERVGGITIVGNSTGAAETALSHAKQRIRANYSNPPFHGGAIVTTILEDKELTSIWKDEVSMMRIRINSMRRLFVETLKNKGAKQDFSFITKQHGMFSFSGLNKDQVKELREKHGVYIVDSGRISVAGMLESNMDALCDAIVAVL